GTRDAPAPEHADRRFTGRAASAPRLAVEEALHVGEEGHELRVVPLAELLVVVRELVLDLAPRGPGLAQALPRPLDLRVVGRHDLERPEEDLPEVIDGRRVGDVLRHGSPLPDVLARPVYVR